VHREVGSAVGASLHDQPLTGWAQVEPHRFAPETVIRSSHHGRNEQMFVAQ
jgi:hypothetical protein